MPDGLGMTEKKETNKVHHQRAIPTHPPTNPNYSCTQLTHTFVAVIDQQI